MTAARELRARARAAWGAVRARAPRAVGTAAVWREAARGTASAAAELVELRRRVHALERDHDLLAAHVRAITEQAGGVASAGDRSAQERADRLAAARLEAAASYEHRIQALEAKRPRDTPGRARDGHPVGEFRVNER